MGIVRGDLSREMFRELSVDEMSSGGNFPEMSIGECLGECPGGMSGSLCSSYNLCHSVNTHTHRQLLTSYTISSASTDKTENIISDQQQSRVAGRT